MMYVQYGAGLCAPSGWVNFDSSPRLWAERLPLIGRFAGRLFPADVRFGNIVSGLPVAAGTADGVYASHVLEHLSRADFDDAIGNTFTMLKPRGIFRLIVPDLEVRALRYLKKLASSSAANDWFMIAAGLGAEDHSTRISRMIESIGGTRHMWMWDWPSMNAALAKAGFVEIRRCAFGDCVDTTFKEVEDPGRFYDTNHDIAELAVEARKPARLPRQ
jgi:SAM-dependent methyltransferase